MFGTKQSAGHLWSTYVNRFSFTKWLNSSYALSWQPFPHSLRNQCLLVLYSYYGNGYYVFWIPFHTHYKVANSSLPLSSLPPSLSPPLPPPGARLAGDSPFISSGNRHCSTTHLAPPTTLHTAQEDCLYCERITPLTRSVYSYRQLEN